MQRVHPTHGGANVIFAQAQSFLAGTFDPAIPTLQDVAGYRPGQQISRPEVIVKEINGRRHEL